MRLHRGSSKDAAGLPRATGSLPLSASATAPVTVLLEVQRAAAVERRRVRLLPGATVRDALHAVGRSAEGCAVLVREVPVPLDLPVSPGLKLTVVPTFSGG